MTPAQQLYLHALEHANFVMEQAAIRLEKAETEAEVREIQRQVKVAWAWCLGGFESDEEEATH